MANNQEQAGGCQPMVIAALYKFAPLDDFEELRQPLLDFCSAHELKGTLLLAKEGINGTVSGSRNGIDALVKKLQSDARLADLEYKESFGDAHPFLKMKVRLKKEIVTMKTPEIDPTKMVGSYVKPKDWNDLITDPSVMVIDTRNKYEYEIGTFKNAINPETETFGEFPEFCEKSLSEVEKDKKIAMFCTGGIRCEKATSYLKHKGFKNVYHLKGGILKYLEDVPPEESEWNGECYVFDNRVAVQHGLTQGCYDRCAGCRGPLSKEDKQSDLFKNGVHCPKCYGNVPESHLKRAEARHRQMVLAEERNELHLGSVYKKKNAAFGVDETKVEHEISC